MTDRQATCEERIAAQMTSREEDFARMFEQGQSDDDKEREEASDQLAEYPLGIETYTVARIELSTGGPADWLEVKLSRGKYGYEVERVIYHFSDWFDHAERVVEEGSDLWRAAEYYCETLSVEG